MDGSLVSSGGPRGVGLGSAGGLRRLWVLAGAPRGAEGRHEGPVAPFVSGCDVAGVTGGHLGTRKERTHQHDIRFFTATFTGSQTAESAPPRWRALLRSDTWLTYAVVYNEAGDDSQLRFFPSALPNIPGIYGTDRKIPGLDKVRRETVTWFISRRGRGGAVARQRCLFMVWIL